MNRESAIAKIMASIEDGAEVICPDGAELHSYRDKQINLLLSNVINPVRVKVVAASYPEYYFDNYKNSQVWGIAKSGSDWLITLDSENEFALAWGENPEEITMLGFSSSDVLAEWLG